MCYVTPSLGYDYQYYSRREQDKEGEDIINWMGKK